MSMVDSITWIYHIRPSCVAGAVLASASRWICGEACAAYWMLGSAVKSWVYECSLPNQESANFLDLLQNLSIAVKFQGSRLL